MLITDPKNFLSVNRFLALLKTARPEQGTPIRIGGKVVCDGGHFALTGQGQNLWFESSPARLQGGELVAIEFLIDDFKVDQLRIEKVKKLEVLQSGNANSDFDPNPGFHFVLAKKWAEFLAKIRAVMHMRGIQEVTTPTLVCNPGMEPELEPFVTEWRRSVQGKKQQAFLCTSPELHMKQLLVKGFTDIYEVKTVFRNEEKTTYHEPEFQMLEWYRAYAGLDLIIEDLQAILQACGFFDATEKKLQQITVADIWQKSTGKILRPETSREELLRWLQEWGESPSVQSSWSDLFHHIWVARVEPRLPKTPFLLINYPPELAALARLDESGWAQRFEFFLNGVEIANAFLELTDPAEQRERFIRDQSLRKKYGRTELEIDENFMKALDAGMPPSAGIALGLDRLFQALNQLERLQDGRAFSVVWEFKI